MCHNCKPITIHCSICDSQNILRDAHATWDPELQVWELSNTYDDFFCDDCGQDVSITERLISDQTKEQVAEEEREAAALALQVESYGNFFAGEV